MESVCVFNLFNSLVIKGFLEKSFVDSIEGRAESAEGRRSAPIYL